MAAPLKFLTYFNNLVAGHPICFMNSLLVVLSAGGEEFFRWVAFTCPADREFAPEYARIFAYAPICVLFICGWTLNTRLWRVFHGCWKRHEIARLTWGQQWRSFLNVFLQSLVAPSIWLLVSLLDGSFYVCIYANSDEEKAILKARSQRCGWAWLVTVVGLGSLVTCFMRCCDTKTFLELRYAEVYKSVEEEELQKKMTEKSKVLANGYVTDLFNSPLPAKETWDIVTIPDSTETTKVYYSPLQKWYYEKLDKKSQSANQTSIEMDFSKAGENSGSGQMNDDGAENVSGATLQHVAGAGPPALLEVALAGGVEKDSGPSTQK